MTQEVLAGGYPEMRQRSTAARRQAWASAYITTLIERDIQDVAQILDAGLQSTLSRLTPELTLLQRTRFGATLETWVYAELLKLLSVTPEPWFLSHYRDKDQLEVDFVLESASREPNWAGAGRW